jgi:hypothetical protein
MKTGKIVFTWIDFMDKFVSMLCPENKATIAHMAHKSK